MAIGIKVSDEFFKKFGKKFPAESFLMREGDPGNTFFIINTGKVAIIKSTPSGEKVLATLGEGDFFGEMAMLGLQERRAAAAKTMVETQVLELNRDAFESIIRRSPDIAMSVIKSLSERVRDSNGKLSALVHKDDRVRIANYLNFLASDRGVPAPQNNPGRCFVMKVREVSGILGTSVEVINQFLDMLKKLRFLGQNGDWVWIPHPQYLQPFCDYLLAKKV